MQRKIIISLIIIILIGSFSFQIWQNNKISIKDYLTQKEKVAKRLFDDYYDDAQKIMDNMTLDEKISQLLLVRHMSSNDLNIQNEYQFGGIIFFGSDFKNKTKEEVQKMINDLQNISKIPIITAIDEEGGTVSRISSNPNLVDEPFKSPQELYKINGFDTIYDDVIKKSSILEELGLNLNLAPVVDVSTNPSDYMYKRSLGMDTEHTSIFAKTVIEASHKGNVTYTLKHFPGYGNNVDTHQTESIDNKSYEDLLKIDIPPFQEGIKAQAEAILVSHNTVMAIDPDNPASLSLDIHKLLIDDLKFTGLIITDDISMNALNNITDTEVKAIQAQNDILITSDYKKSFTTIKKALDDGIIKEEEINNKVLKILAWKCYKNLIHI